MTSKFAKSNLKYMIFHGEYKTKVQLSVSSITILDVYVYYTCAFVKCLMGFLFNVLVRLVYLYDLDWEND